ncbi:hypothetical protein LINGRAHAP2_LOCUS4507 [Linum grandiflorum]
MDARISFSNDFVDTHQQHQHQHQHSKTKYREAPVSSDFEFSVKDFTLIPADEIFFKGVMVPLKEDEGRKMTLREELMVDVDDLPTKVPPKISGWWKEKLGFKRGNNNNSVAGKRNGHGMVLERIEEKRPSSFVHGDTLSLGSAN